MTNLERQLTDMLRPATEAAGYELLGLEFVRAGKHSTLRLYIDHENGINVDDCAEVSHQVSAVLDVEDPIATEYNLEVSSPGLERPLFEAEQFAAFIGEEAEVRLKAAVNKQRKLQGTLVAVNGPLLTMKVKGSELELAFDNIERANLIARI